MSFLNKTNWYLSTSYYFYLLILYLKYFSEDFKDIFGIHRNYINNDVYLNFLFDSGEIQRKTEGTL